MANLIDAHAVLKTEFLQRHAVVFAVLAATGVPGVGAGGEHQNIAVPFLISLLYYVGHIGFPVAVCPHDRNMRPTFLHGFSKCHQKRTVLLVNGRDTTVCAVVGGDFLQTFIGYAAPRRNVAQEGNHVFLSFGPAEGGKNHQVIGGRHGGARTGNTALPPVRL